MELTKTDICTALQLRCAAPLYISNIPGVIYNLISNAVQYSDTALETTPLVMCDSNTFFYVVPLFLMTLQIS